MSSRRFVVSGSRVSCELLSDDLRCDLHCTIMFEVFHSKYKPGSSGRSWLFGNSSYTGAFGAEEGALGCAVQEAVFSKPQLQLSDDCWGKSVVGYFENCARQTSLRSLPQNGQKHIWTALPSPSDGRNDSRK
jgi:hypothetical protein